MAKSKSKPPSPSTPEPEIDLSQFGVLELDVDPDVQPILALLVEERNRAKSMTDSNKVLRESLDEQIEALLIETGYSRIFLPDGRKIVRANGCSAATLSAKLLVENGVDPDLIAQCTVPGKKYTYIQIPEQTKDDKVTLQLLDAERRKKQKSRRQSA